MATTFERSTSTQDVEELALKLLSSLPRSRLATVHRQITSLLQFDVVGSLPTEVALQIFTYVPYQTLLTCSLVCKRWQRLANDQTVWKRLCDAHGWAWRHPPRLNPFPNISAMSSREWDHSDDEGMGDSDEDPDDKVARSMDQTQEELTMLHEQDSGFVSMSMSATEGPSTVPMPESISPATSSSTTYSRTSTRYRNRSRHSAPSVLALAENTFRKPDYKLLHQTHIRLRNRFLSSSYRLSALQTRGAPGNAHTHTIYCLQLYTDPETGRQVLFTGSRDKSVREWNLSTGLVDRIINGVHTCSVLSLCASNGYLASTGTDKRVALWDLTSHKVVKVICDHEESVLCVRFNKEKLVSCSKDRTIRVYSFPSLRPKFILEGHRAAVNAVSLSDSYIVSASGDRSIKLWDIATGNLLRTFDDHHTRGIASIDFKPPIIVSGSSDKHVRSFDISTLQGWSTALEFDSRSSTSPNGVLPFPVTSAGPDDSIQGVSFLCQACGSDRIQPLPSAVGRHAQCAHRDLVRSVALGEDFIVSGGYDLTIKVWDRKTGALVANLTGGHTGRIFCLGFDRTKIVSCGEDQRICIWDFSHGLDTSFLQL